MTRNQKIAAVVAAAIAGWVVMTVFNPTDQGWPFRCPFKLVTGLQCPGCGGQRALHALTQGHLREAIGYNLFLVYAAPYALALVAANLMPEGKARSKALRWLEQPALVWFYVISAIAWIIIRNILHI